MKVARSEIEPVAEARARAPGGSVSLPVREDVPRELHLLGLTSDEARAAVEKFLDDAALAGHRELRLIHGKGTGALRRAVEACLRGSLVASSRLTEAPAAQVTVKPRRGRTAARRRPGPHAVRAGGPLDECPEVLDDRARVDRGPRGGDRAAQARRRALEGPLPCIRKTPSFTVSPKQNVFYFGSCRRRRFEFLRRHDRLEFPRAPLAERAGVLPGREDPETGARDGLLALMEWAARRLRRDQGGAEARAPAPTSRLKDRPRHRLPPGYAPEGWDHLLGAARRRTIGGVAHGGARDRQNASSHYDRFRGRLIFPIDTQGRHRVRRPRLAGEGQYLNSRTALPEGADPLLLHHARARGGDAARSWSRATSTA